MIRMIKTIQKAKNITNITKILADDEDCRFKVKSASNNEYYNVSCLNTLWRCDCKDFEVHALHKDDGSYLCKHIYAVISTLSGLSIAEAFEIVELDEDSEELIQTQIARQLLDVHNHLTFLNNCHVETSNHTLLVGLKDYLLNHEEALKIALTEANKTGCVP